MQQSGIQVGGKRSNQVIKQEVQQSKFLLMLGGSFRASHSVFASDRVLWSDESAIAEQGIHPFADEVSSSVESFSR